MTEPVRRYGNFQKVTLATVADVSPLIETVSTEIRDALVNRPDIRDARLVQATVRIVAFNDGAAGPTHRLDWLLEVPNEVPQT